MGSKRTYTVKEIQKLQRAESDLHSSIAAGGSTLLETEAHAIEGAAHTSKSGALLVRNVISPAQLVANTDNWNPTGLATADVIRASTDASRNLTGIVAPTSGFQAIVLANIGAFDLVLKHDATSTAVNRFLCPNDTDVTLQKRSTAILVYDLTTTRWRVIGGGGGGGGGVTDHGALTGLADDDHPQYASNAEFDDHSARHEDGGADEISLTGLSGTPADLTTHAGAADPHTGYVLESLLDAKGDLIAASADNTPAKVTVGANGTHLVARSGETPGVKWEDDTGELTIVIDGGGAVISTGVKVDIPIKRNLTFTGWTLLADQSGAIKIDLWADTLANYPPTDADSITNGHEPEIAASGTNADDAAITDWSGEARTAGDTLRVNVDSVTSIRRVTLGLLYVRT